MRQEEVHQEEASSRGFLSKVVFKNFAKFTEKHLCQNPFLIKLQAANLKLSEAATGDVQSNKVRSSRPDLFCKKDVIKHFVNFTGKHLCQSLFFNNVSFLTLFKIRLWHRRFLLHFAKFLRTPFHTEQLWWLLL